MTTEDEVHSVEHVVCREDVWEWLVQKVLLDAEPLNAPTSPPDIRLVRNSVRRLLSLLINTSAISFHSRSKRVRIVLIVNQSQRPSGNPAHLLYVLTNLSGLAHKKVRVLLILCGEQQLDRR